MVGTNPVMEADPVDLVDRLLALSVDNRCPQSAFVPDDCAKARATNPRHPGTPDSPHVAQRFRHQSGTGCQRQPAPEFSQRIAGLDNGHWRIAELRHLRRNRHQKRPAAGKKHPAGRWASGFLHHDLQAAGGCHARQMPTGSRQNALDCANGEDYRAGRKLAHKAALPVFYEDLPVTVDAEKHTGETRRNGLRGKRFGQRLPAVIHAFGLRQRRDPGNGLAIDSATDRAALLHNFDGEAAAADFSCGRKSCRTGADDKNIKFGQWRASMISTVIPAQAGVRQVSPGTPSTSARQD
jgi:hypothetical protein